MARRFLVIAAATALAALVLGLTILLGGQPPRQEGQAKPRITAMTTPPAFTGQPGELDPRKTLIEGASNYLYERTNERGQRYRLTGQTLEPQPNFQSRIGKPSAEMFLTPYRVIRITAEQGSIYMPENQPQSGQLEGDVVLTLYESPPDRPVDLDDPQRDVQLRCRFDEPVKFDLGLGQIDSAGAVTLTGPRVDFSGSGLTIIYNEKRSRIDLLQVARGKMLRLRAPAPQPSPTEPAAGGDAPSRTTTRDPSRTRARPETQEIPYYRARFDRRVQVASRDIRELEADLLTVVFSLHNRGDRASLLGSTQETTPAPAGEPRPAVTVTEPRPTPTVEDTAEEEDELVITWSGPMVVEPEEAPPIDLAGADDVLLSMTGRPVRILTSREELIVAAGMDYLASSGRLRLIGSESFPMRIDSPRLGVLVGPQLEINQATGLGQVVGAGSLSSSQSPSLVAQVEPGAVRTDQIGLPRGSKLAWQDRLDLAFHPQTTRSAQGHDPRLFGALKSAAFRGAVKVTHPQLDLTADLLSLAMQPRDVSASSQSIQQLSAAGNVAVATRQVGQQPAMQIRSDQLQIDLTPDDRGQPTPSRLAARGHVVASQTGRVLQAGALDVALAPARTRRDDDTPPLEVRAVEASRSVHIVMDDPALTITADRLTGDAQADQLELFGRPAQPATLARRDGTLSGQHVILNQASQLVNVAGAGAFLFRDENDPSSADVHVTWRDNMTFDNRSGLARFIGEVRTTARSGRDTVELNARQMALEFSPRLAEESRAAAGDAPDTAAAFGAVRNAVADGDAVLLAANWSDHPGGTLTTRVRLAGPTLAFDNLAEELQVVGEGTMLVEDYRPADDRPTGARPVGEGTLRSVAIAGRGVTLFTWNDTFLLDARQNDMRLEGRVRMLHRPADGSDPVQLDCRRLTADLEATGGLGVWTTSASGGASGGKTPQPRLIAINADYDVRVMSGGRIIYTDHLQYTGFNQNVTLRADPGRQTRIYEQDQPTGLTAEGFRWDLARNRIEIERPGPGRMTIPKGR